MKVTRTKNEASDRYKYLQKVASVWNDIENFPTHKSVADNLKIPKASVRRLLIECRRCGIQIRKRFLINNEVKEHETASQNKYARENLTLKMQIKQLKELLDASHADSIINERINRIIKNASDTAPQCDLSWLKYKYKGQSSKSVPVLFLSDLHFDEVVQSSQVDYMNEYNREIAIKRIQAVFDNSLELLTEKIKANYSGIVVCLGGDLLSGNIHEELAETNEATILESILKLTDLLQTGLTKMVDKFGKLYVPCVVGNHGRIHKKPRAKFKVQQNYEWIIYKLLETRFSSDSRVTFEIPNSADVTFKIFDVTFLMTHGDQFKGGSGISGIFTPLMLGASRKLKRQQAAQRPFDVMMVGHFHSYLHTGNLIVNGTTKGIDEYSYQMNFGYEEPQQALFLVNEKHGITIRLPVLCK